MNVIRRLLFILLSFALLYGLATFAAAPQPAFYRLFLLLAAAALLALWVYPVEFFYSPRWAPLIVLGAFLLFQIAWQPPLKRYGYVYVGLGWLAIVVTLLFTRSSSRTLRAVLLVLVGLGLFEAFYGLLQSIGGWDYIGDYYRGLGRRASGTFGNRNHFAGLLNMTIPLALGALYATFPRRSRKLRSEGYAWAWIVLMTCAFMGLAILLSLSRGGTLSFVASVLFLSLLMALRPARSRVASGRLSGRAGALLLATALALGLWVGIDALIDRFAVPEAGAAERLTAFKETVQLIADHPLGLGPRMFRWRFQPSENLTQACWWTHVHNDYLETAADWGLPVAALFWGFVIWRLVAATRTFLRLRSGASESGDILWRQGVALGSAGAILSILIHSLFDFNLQIAANWVIFCVVLTLSWMNDRGVAPGTAGRGLAARLGLRLAMTVLLTAAGWAVVREVAAMQIASAGSIEDYQEALSWVPNESSYHLSLGVLYRDSLDRQNPELAGPELKEAARLNPFDWRNWQELGRYYDFVGDPQNAEKARLKALQIRPLNAEERWMLGNFYLREGRLPEALAHIGRAIELDQSYREATLLLLWKAGLLEDRLDQIWPSDQQSQLMLVRFLVDKGEALDGIRQAWSRYIARAEQEREGSGGREVQKKSYLRSTDFYLEYLARAGRIADLREEWTRINRFDNVRDQDFETGANLVWNGGFESGMDSGFLDWRLRGATACSIEVADGQGPDGSRALRIEFLGSENLIFVLAQQILLPGPGRYRFSAMARSEDLTTEEGLCLWVLGGPGGGRLAETQQIRGTTPWTRYEGEFVAPEGSQMVSVQVRRNQSRRIDNKIKGVFWLDDVRVRPAD